MLVTLQFPFTDVRPFVPHAQTHLVLVPAWGNLNPSQDYVRGIGPIRERDRGRVQEWSGEEDFCRVSRAVRFPPSYHVVSGNALEALNLRRYCAFRRFFADGRFPDGSVVARLELGFGFRSRKGARLVLTPEECIACALSTLELKIATRKDGSPRVARLIELRQLFDDLYLRSTTKLKTEPPAKVESWWFRPGQPIAVVEYTASRSAGSLPAIARQVPGLKKWGIDLAYLRQQFKGIQVGIWLVGVPAGVRDRDLLRRLRVTLLRLHAERQCIAEVFRQVRSKRIVVDSEAGKPGNLEKYVEKAVEFLKKSYGNGLPQSEIINASRDAEDLVQPGERERLLAEFAKIEPLVFRQVVGYVKSQTGAAEGALGAAEFSDVFLSHNSKDKPVVRELGFKLLARSLRVWLDEWDLIPGRSWIQAIQQAIETARSAAVLYGPAGVGPWEQPEMEALLIEAVDRKLPLIPVLMPGAPEKPALPPFLKPFTWVDLREGLTPANLDRLESGIRGTKPGPVRPATAP